MAKLRIESPHPSARLNHDRLIIIDEYIKLKIYLSTNTKQVQKVILPWKQHCAPFMAAQYVVNAFGRIIRFLYENREQYGEYTAAVKTALAQFKAGVNRSADSFIEQQLKNN